MFPWTIYKYIIYTEIPYKHDEYMTQQIHYEYIWVHDFKGNDKYI